jgi:hypothetical protein
MGLLGSSTIGDRLEDMLMPEETDGSEQPESVQDVLVCDTLSEAPHRRSNAGVVQMSLTMSLALATGECSHPVAGRHSGTEASVPEGAPLQGLEGTLLAVAVSERLKAGVVQMKPLGVSVGDTTVHGGRDAVVEESRWLVRIEVVRARREISSC